MSDHAKAERLRALARNLMEYGDITPSGRDVLLRVADEWDPPENREP